MPRRYHFLAVIILLLQCATIFDRRSDFEKAIAHYREADMEKAIHYFERCRIQHPASDTVLYFLYDCYRRQGNHPAQIGILETLAQRASPDPHVYTILLDHYDTDRADDRFFALYGSIPGPVRPVIDARYVLTRGMYARLCAGAVQSGAGAQDPMRHAIVKGYLPLSADGIYYQEDTMTIGNLIVTLDNLLEPVYPKRFYPLSHVSERSFLYLPYMRLVDSGILSYERDVDPDMIAPVSTAVRAIRVMVERGYID